PCPREPYALSLHDALPISDRSESRSRTCEAVTTWSSRHARPLAGKRRRPWTATTERPARWTAFARPSDRLASTLLDVSESVMEQDRKSTRLNSSHVAISYA